MNASLQQTLNGWSFLSEAALENFVWNNLQSLLGYIPLRRQYVCNGEVCDILATAPNRTLVVLELKNVEDRYLIQQLTRYYANLIKEHPFEEQVDYSLPVKLVAVAPDYHRHNLINRQYSRLEFQLWQFAVVGQPESLSLQLTNPDRQECRAASIVYSPPVVDASSNIAEPPTVLLSWLGSCTVAEQEGILRLRSRLLVGNSRIKETIERNRIQYGSGKTKLCAELIFQPSKQRPVLFLWLPTPSSSLQSLGQKEVIGRLRIWMDGTSISHVGHVAEGLGKMRTKAEWMELPTEKRPRRLTEGLSYKSHTPVEAGIYLKIRFKNHENVPTQNTWDILTDLALEAWQART